MTARTIAWQGRHGWEAVEVPAGSEIERRGGIPVAVVVGGRRLPVRVAAAGERIFVWCAGQTWEFAAGEKRRRRSGAAADDAALLAPMPGRVLKVCVSSGERVARGTTLLVLEAMKMEHEIKAARDGVVARLPFRAGDSVDAGAPLVEFAG